MKKTPRISDAEWQVMKVLWARWPVTAAEVVQALAHSRWSDKTVRTLLNRLVRKRAAGFDKNGRTYLYRPLVDEQQCIHAETRSFLDRVYDGALLPMIAGFLDQTELSPQEIAELKRLLETREEAT